MPEILINLYGGYESNINSSDLQSTPYAGGQGKIFTYEYNGKKYLLKPFPFQPNIVNRMNQMYERVRQQSGGEIAENVYKRTFPRGYGKVNPMLVGYKRAKQIPFLIFEYIDGKTLQDLFNRQTKPYISKFESYNSLMSLDMILNYRNRLKICKTLLEKVCVLHKSGVTMIDIKPENFIIDRNNEVHIIDIEGGGIYNEGEDSWILMPVVNQVPDIGWSSPKEVELSIYTDRWYITLLVWRILTDVLHPFIFLKQNNHNVFKYLQRRTLYLLSQDESLKDNPNFADILRNINIENNLLVDNFIITQFAKDIKGVLKNDFLICLTKTLILGFDQKELRTNAETLLNSIIPIYEDFK